MYATVYVICAKTFTNHQRIWESPCWCRTRLHLLSLPVTMGGHPRKRGQARGILLPGTLPASKDFLLRGFPDLVHIIVSTSPAKSSGNLYAAKPLATTTDINQAEFESLTIIGKIISVIGKTYMSFDLNLS